MLESSSSATAATQRSHHRADTEDPEAGFIRIPRKIFVLKKIFALILHFEFYRYIILVLTFYNHIIIALEKPNINILLLEILKSTIDT